VQKPPGYNDWNENEDMVAFYLETIHAQLQQAYVGMALAVASKRAFVLPTVQATSLIVALLLLHALHTPLDEQASLLGRQWQLRLVAKR
jgi:hypothetical protein